MEGTDETRLIDEVARRKPCVVDKGTYSGANTDLAAILTSHVGYEPGSGVDICGVDTEACVYLTAASLMDTGLDVRVIRDLCASGGGIRLHESMIPVMERTLGADHIISVNDIERGDA